jgi:peptidoglycan hydrolase CwlO-like protein
METITMLIVALAPAIGVLSMIIGLTAKIIKRFNDLRAEVKDDKTINALLTDNKKLAKLYSDTMTDVKELSTQVDNLRKITVELAEKYNIDTDKLVKELIELKDNLTDVVKENKELQKELNYTISAASNEEV